MRILIFFIICIFSQSLSAQYNDSITVAILPCKSDISTSIETQDQIENWVTTIFSDDYRMILIDRSEMNIVARERNLQRDEDYIDGKIVEQGKAFGAEYLVDLTADHQAKKILVKIFDVKDGSLKGSTSSPLKVKTTWRTSTFAQLKDNVDQLLNKAFGEITFIITSADSENKRKVKSLVVYAGSRMKIKKKQLMEVQVEVEENVGGQKKIRYQSAGWGKIRKVDGADWSILKLEAGKKNIKKLLKQGKKLRCRIIEKEF